MITNEKTNLDTKSESITYDKELPQPNSEAKLAITKINERLKKYKFQLTQSDDSISEEYEFFYELSVEGVLIGLCLYNGNPQDGGLINKIEIEDVLYEISLDGLMELKMNNCNLSSINNLSHFKNIQYLSCSNTLLLDLCGIEKLHHLEILDVKENKIENLKGVASCKKLNSLTFYNTDVSSIKEIKKLINLVSLHLGGTKVCNLSDIKELINLEVLYCWHTQIQSLEPIANLHKLKAIYCQNTSISNFDIALSLKDLNNIFALDCKVTNISEELLEFDIKLGNSHIPISNSMNIKSLYLSDNPINFPPIEIITRGNDVTKRYFDSLQGETDQLNEAKLVLIGEGYAGKTSLLKRLINNDFSPEEDKTDGIAITNWPVKISEQESIKIHCWDFGGQEIMRATHQLFLSKRSIYIVVLDGRKDEKPEHWLKQVITTSKDSPIFMVLNKSDEHFDDNITRQRLKEKYPNIVGFYKTSCKKNTGIEDLKKSLIQQVTDLDMRKFVLARNWLNVKEKMEEVKNTKDYISHQLFIDLCNTNYITDPIVQDILLTLLNDLGQVIHFKELEELQTQVLNPTWITEGIYALINSEELTKQHGVISKEQASKILEDKLEKNRFNGKTSYLMKVMEQFELCYQIVSLGLKNNNPKYLIPDLLPAELKTNPKLNEGIEFIIQYQGYLPPEIMARFIVKSHEYQVPNKSWRYGVLLHNEQFNSDALITQDKEDKVVRIKVHGSEQRGFLAVIRNYFSEIHNNYEQDNIGLKEFLPLKSPKSNEESWLSYSRLVKIEKRILVGNDSDQQYDDELEIEYSVSSLLDGIQSAEQRHKQYKQESEKGLTLNITQNANPIIEQTVEQNNNQTNTQEVSISISLKIQDFKANLEGWGEDLIEDLSSIPAIQEDESLKKLLPRSQKELNRVTLLIDEVSGIENKEEAQSDISKFTKIRSFLEDGINGVNKTGELLKKAGEGVSKLQSLGKEYNKIADIFMIPQVPSYLLGKTSK